MDSADAKPLFSGQLAAALYGQAAAKGASAGPTAQTVSSQPPVDTYTDDELREELRRSLYSVNRSAEGITRMRESLGDGGQETWRAR